MFLVFIVVHLLNSLFSSNLFRLPYFRMHLEPNQIQEIRDALNQQLVLGRDDFKDKFEEKFREFLL